MHVKPLFTNLTTTGVLEMQQHPQFGPRGNAHTCANSLHYPVLMTFASKEGPFAKSRRSYPLERRYGLRRELKALFRSWAQARAAGGSLDEGRNLLSADEC